MKRKAIFFFFYLIFSGCTLDSDEDCDSAPINCKKDRPDSVELKLKLSVSSNNPPARLKIYSGSMDEGRLVLEDSALVKTKGYLLPEGYYSVQAIYIAGKDTLEILEGGETKIEVSEYCGGVNCYNSSSATLDLRLRDLPKGVSWP